MSQQHSGSAWRSRLGGALVGVLVVVLGAVGARLAHWVEYTAPWPPWSSTKITITPPDGAVPQCAIIKGSGAIPAGKTLWVAERERGDENYYTLTAAEPDPSGGWRATIDLGARGTQFDIVAFLLEGESTKLLRGLRVEADPPTAEAFYYLQEGAVEHPSLRTILRDPKDTNPCRE